MAAKNDNSLLRNIGQFVGHIAHAVKADPTLPDQPPAPASTPEQQPPAAVRTTVEERISPDGTLILRRTTIDEIAVADGRAHGTDGTDRAVPDRPME